MSRLVNTRTGKDLVVGSKAVTFRDENVTVMGWRDPTHSGSTGRVFLQFESDNYEQEYFPSVIDAQIIEYEAEMDLEP